MKNKSLHATSTLALSFALAVAGFSLGTAASGKTWASVWKGGNVPTTSDALKVLG